MKVIELIDILKKCSPDADVTCVYSQDDPTDGSGIEDVVEIRFLTTNLPNTVVLRY